jgi:hypothetical protein
MLRREPGALQGDVEKGVRYGIAFPALEHSTPEDVHWGTPEEVEVVLKGGGLRIWREGHDRVRSGHLR